MSLNKIYSIGMHKLGKRTQEDAYIENIKRLNRIVDYLREQLSHCHMKEERYITMIDELRNNLLTKENLYSNVNRKRIIQGSDLSKQYGKVNYHKQTISNMKKKMNDMERELETLKAEKSFDKLRSRFDNLRKKTPLSSKVPSFNELTERFKLLKELKGRKKTKRKIRRKGKGKKRTKRVNTVKRRKSVKRRKTVKRSKSKKKH